LEVIAEDFREKKSAAVRNDENLVLGSCGA
jgi:hypothetical protein